jgi:hypothetical protein
MVYRRSLCGGRSFRRGRFLLEWRHQLVVGRPFARRWVGGLAFHGRTLDVPWRSGVGRDAGLVGSVPEVVEGALGGDVADRSLQGEHRLSLLRER